MVFLVLLEPEFQHSSWFWVLVNGQDIGHINSHKHLCNVAGISKAFSSKAQAKKGRKAAQGWTNNAARFKIAFRLTIFHCKSKHLQNWLRSGKKQTNKQKPVHWIPGATLSSPKSQNSSGTLHTLAHFRCLPDKALCWTTVITSQGNNPIPGSWAVQAETSLSLSMRWIIQKYRM